MPPKNTWKLPIFNELFAARNTSKKMLESKMHHAQYWCHYRHAEKIYIYTILATAMAMERFHIFQPVEVVVVELVELSIKYRHQTLRLYLWRFRKSLFLVFNISDWRFSSSGLHFSFSLSVLWMTISITELRASQIVECRRRKSICASVCTKFHFSMQIYV